MTTWKTARVFISSTFSDMHAERDHLARFVFPELRERCAAIGVHVIDVDLRWGVTEEQVKQNRVVEICLDEIDNCRPFFIGLLGERFGMASANYEVPDQSKFAWVNGFRHQSLTALEIRHAILNNLNTNMRASFYFRDLRNLEDIPADMRKDFLPASPTEKKRINELKKEIRRSGVPVETYHCNYDHVESDRKVRFKGLESFGEKVLENLWQAIREEFSNEWTRIDTVGEENFYQEIFAEESAMGFIGRHEVLKNLAKFIETPGKPLLVVSGIGGIGKSATLAKFARSYAETHPDYFILTHFIGISPDSADIRRTLQRLCRELKQRFDLKDEIPSEYYRLQPAFSRFLELSAKAGKVVVIIDAVEQLADSDFARDVDWLPAELPESLKLIVSSVNGEIREKLIEHPLAPPEIVIPPLDDTEQEEFIRNTFANYGKSLDKAQLQLLLRKKNSRNPLYLAGACEEMRISGVFERLSSEFRSLPDSVESLFEQVLDRVEKDQGKSLVKEALLLLACSRYGILESEMLELLAPIGDERLPYAIWAGFYRSLKFYLRPSGVAKNSDSEMVSSPINFFHRQFADAVRRRYLKTEKIVVDTHRRLARYFRHKADPQNDGAWNGAPPRALSELPFHQLAGRLYPQLFATARNSAFSDRLAIAFSRDIEKQTEAFEIAIVGAGRLEDAALMVEFMFRRCLYIKNATEMSAPAAYKKLGDVSQCLGICANWLLRNREVGALQFLFLALELRKADRDDDARQVLRQLGRRAVELTIFRDDIWSELAAFALSRIFDLDLETFKLVQSRIFGRKGKFELCRNLLISQTGKDPLLDDEREAAVLSAAAGILFDHRQAEAYGLIANAQLKANRDASETLRLAIECSGNLDLDARGKHFALKSVAEIQARMGKYEDAFQTINKMDGWDNPATRATLMKPRRSSLKYEQDPITVDDMNKSDRQEACQSIAKIQALAGDYEDAVKTVEKLDEYEGKSTYRSIARILAKSGRWEEAIETAGRTEPYFRVESLKEISDIFIRARNYQAALKIVEQVPDREAFSILESIAVGVAGAGNHDGALQIVNSEEGFDKNKVYLAIAKDEAVKGNLQNALKTARTIENYHLKAQAYSWIAYGTIRAGKKTSRIFAQTLENIAKIDSPVNRLRGYLSAAQQYKQAALDPSPIFLLALAAAEAIEDPVKRFESELSMADCRIFCGLEISFERIVSSVKKIKDPGFGKMNDYYTKIALIQAKSGNYRACGDTIETEFSRDGYRQDAIKSILEKNGTKDSADILEMGLRIVLEKAADFEMAFNKVMVYLAIAQVQITQEKSVEKALDLSYCAVEKVDDERKVGCYTLIIYLENQVGINTKCAFDLAFESAAQIDNNEKRVEAYVTIAEAIARIGKNSVKAYDMALGAAKTERGFDRARIYEHIARSQLKAGLFREALKTALRISDLKKRAKFYADVALAYAQKARIKEAIRISGLISRRLPIIYAYSICKIAETQARRGKYTSALKILQTVPNQELKAQTTSLFAEIMAADGNYDKAFKIAKTIKKNEWKIEAHASIIREYARQRDYDNAVKFASEIADPYQQCGSYELIAKEQIMAGDSPSAVIEIALEIVDRINDLEHRVMTYLEIAKLQIVANIDASGTINRSVKATGRFRNSGTRAYYYREVAAITEGEKTSEILDLGVQASVDMEDDTERSEMLKSIALTARHGIQAPDPYELKLQTALSARNMVDHVPLKSRYHISYVAGLVTSGKYDAAIRALESVSVDREKAILKVASLFAYSGNKTYFKRLLIPASNYPHICYGMSSFAALLFPDQSDALVEVLANVEN
jgi:hypothetical protein